MNIKEWASWMAQWVQKPPAVQETHELWVLFLGQEDPLEKEMATHSSIIAWKNPRDREAWWAIVPKSETCLSTQAATTSQHEQVGVTSCALLFHGLPPGSDAIGCPIHPPPPLGTPLC